MKEIELIKQAQQGDRRAFSALYGKYKEPLYRYARYRLSSGPDAEDAVSDCILEVWKRLPTLREPAAFRAFAFRILSACCARQIRLQIDRRSKSDIDAPGISQDASLVHTDSTDTHLILAEALRTITDQEREIVLLSAVSGLTSSEIAQITGQPAGTVRSTLSRSLKKLRLYIES